MVRLSPSSRVRLIAPIGRAGFGPARIPRVNRRPSVRDHLDLPADVLDPCLEHQPAANVSGEFHAYPWTSGREGLENYSPRSVGASPRTFWPFTGRASLRDPPDLMPEVEDSRRKPGSTPYRKPSLSALGADPRSRGGRSRRAKRPEGTEARLGCFLPRTSSDRVGVPAGRLAEPGASTRGLVHSRRPYRPRGILRATDECDSTDRAARPAGLKPRDGRSFFDHSGRSWEASRDLEWIEPPPLARRNTGDFLTGAPGDCIPHRARTRRKRPAHSRMAPAATRSVGTSSRRTGGQSRVGSYQRAIASTHSAGVLAAMKSLRTSAR